MKKNVNVQTTTETKTTTVTTVTTTVTTNDATDKAVYIMPIDFITEPGAEKYYKQRGVNVRKVNIFGTDVLCAFIHDEEYKNATPERKAEIRAKSEAFTKAMSDDRRHRAYHDMVARNHESPLDTLIDAGYDPSADSIDVAIKISKKISESENNEDGSASTETKQNDDDRYYGKKPVNKGGYDSSTDLNNPEYIVAKKTLYAKLGALIDELDGEDLEIVIAIMQDKSERKLAEELGIARTTLQAHRAKLMARLRDALKDDYLD